jgi:hypothetical protein
MHASQELESSPERVVVRLNDSMGVMELQGEGETL